MRTIRCKGLDEAIIKLQSYVDRYWHFQVDRNGYPIRNRIIDESRKREWLKATPKDSYGNKDYRVELWVLEGSPAKQIVIINHAMNQIYCFNSMLGKELRIIYGYNIAV